MWLRLDFIDELSVHRDVSRDEQLSEFCTSTDGKVYPFGDAGNFGSAVAPGATFSRIATTTDGLGYRMAASDGRIFSFGSAGSGSSGALGLRQPVVAIANLPA